MSANHELLKMYIGAITLGGDSAPIHILPILAKMFSAILNECSRKLSPADFHMNGKLELRITMETQFESIFTYFIYYTLSIKIKYSR